MPNIREAVIEIRFIAKRAIRNLVKFLGVAGLRYDKPDRSLFISLERND